MRGPVEKYSLSRNGHPMYFSAVQNSVKENNSKKIQTIPALLISTLE
jgi:hypothetical protein